MCEKHLCSRRYDLTPLQHKSYNIEANDQSYVFGICNLAAAPCGNMSGACETSTLGDVQQKVHLGQFNDILEFNETGGPYLIYRNGDPCKGGSQKWTTRIEFVCEKDSHKHGPQVVENVDCELVIHFLTDLVCQTHVSFKFFVYTVVRCRIFVNFRLDQLSCKTRQDDMDIDLTPLMNDNRNYLATVSDKVKRKEGDSVLVSDVFIFSFQYYYKTHVRTVTII